jgi:hypothetical protein
MELLLERVEGGEPSAASSSRNRGSWCAHDLGPAANEGRLEDALAARCAHVRADAGL